MPRSRDIAAELRDECLNQEIFYSLKEAQVVVEQWRTRSAHTHRSDIGRRRRKHPQATSPTYISMHPSSSLYPIGPKYQSGHCLDVEFWRLFGMAADK